MRPADAPSRGSRLSATIRRARKALRRYGLAGSLLHFTRSIRTYAARRRSYEVDRRFDREHGTDTSGIVRLQLLDIPSENRDLGNRYQAIDPSIFRKMIEALDIECARFVFVDYGSGKGRALLLASEYPFRRIVGVEFAPDLHRVAVRNVAVFRSERQVCRNIEPLCMDALLFELPPEPLALFFNNPFEGPLMKKVLAKIAESGRRHPRPIYLILAGDTVHGPSIGAAGFERLDPAAVQGTLGDGERRGLFVMRAP